MKSFALSLSAMLLAVTLAGCSDTNTTTKKDNSDSGAVEVTLKVCPMCQMDVNKEVATTSFDGETIGYCNAHCKETFEKMSDEDKKALLAKLEKDLKEPDHDHEHEADHDHDKKEENKES